MTGNDTLTAMLVTHTLREKAREKECASVCERVCVCVRERERERARLGRTRVLKREWFEGTRCAPSQVIDDARMMNVDHDE